MLVLKPQRTLQIIKVFTFPWINQNMPFFASLISQCLECKAGEDIRNINVVAAIQSLVVKGLVTSPW
jgi:hypothetical protein